MSSNKTIVVAFDLYGTLLSTESIAKKLAEHFGQEKADTLAATWRKYQLEYTWRLNSMGVAHFSRDWYEDFSTITLRSLRHTLAESFLSLPEPVIEELMKAYDSLSTFPDVGPALTKLASEQNITAVVFSNGTQAMVSASVNHSPSLSPHAKVFKDIITVGEVKKFKPSPAVYKHLARKTGKEGKMGEMWLVSGNPFDVVGARSVGMQAAWVDRGGSGFTDGLVEGEKGKPTIVIESLEEVVDVVTRHAEK